MSNRGFTPNKVGKTLKYFIGPFIIQQIESLISSSQREKSIGEKLLDFISENSRYPKN